MTGRGRPRKPQQNASVNDANAPGAALGALQSMMNEMLTEVREIKASQEYMSDAHDDLLTEVRQISHEHKAMKGELRTVSNRQNNMSKEMDDIKMRLNKLEQEKLAAGVIVRGIDETEDALITLKQLADALEVDIGDNTQCVKAQWVRMKRNDDGAAYIRAEMADPDKRNELIKKAKLRKVSTAMLGYAGDNRPIYVDEITTQHTRSLYAEARKLRECGVKFVWMSNGDVLIREKDGAKVQRIDSVYQIERIKRNIASGNSDIGQGASKRPQQNDSFDSDESDIEQIPKRQNRGPPKTARPLASGSRSHTQAPINRAHAQSKHTHAQSSRTLTQQQNAEKSNSSALNRPSNRTIARPHQYVLTPSRRKKGMTSDEMQ